MSYNSPPQPQYGQQPQQQQYYPPPPGGAPPQGQQQTFAPPPSGNPQGQQSYPPPPSGAPPAGQQQQQQQYQQQQYQQGPQQSYQSDIKQSAPPETSDTGNAQGVNYTIKHRNTNSTLELLLPQGATVKAKPGAMIHMQPTVQLKGQVKLSFKKFVTGGSMTESTYTGPGKVTLAPTLLGDIVPLPVDQGHQWTVGKDAFLASTEGIVRETTTQGFGKAMFSGESLFIYRVTGQGTMWLQSYGAIDQIHLGQGEQHIVDNGHLVAWNCNYQMERAGGGASGGGGGGGGFSSMLKGGLDAMKTGEGLVCRFTGPGIVYIQTRNLEEFSRWVASQVPGRAV